MSGRNRKKAKRKNGRSWSDAPWLSGLLLIAVALYMGLSLTGPVGPWWSVMEGEATPDLLAAPNPGGPVGAVLDVALHALFGGLWCWTFPLVVAVLGLGYLTGAQARLRPVLLRALPLWLVSAAWLAQPDGPLPGETAIRFGGVAGFGLARAFHGLFGLWGGRIFLTLALLVTLILIFKRWLRWLPGLLGGVGAGLAWLAAGVRDVVTWPVALVADRAAAWRAGADERARARDERRAAAELAAAAGRGEDDAEFAADPDSDPDSDLEGEAAWEDEDGEDAPAPRERSIHTMPDPEPVLAEEDDEFDAPEELVLPGAAGDFVGDDEPGEAAPRPARRKPRRKRGPMQLPPVELLTPAGPETQQITTVELDALADLLEDTLRSFGVEGEVKDVRPGPVVTTFEYQPGPGIRVNQIVQRSDDLALAMRARSIRMEAPIPGKAAVGIEIPNATARMVRLREVLELTGTKKREPLEVVLGKDVVGRPVSVDLATLPHLLVAGSTGSGKSVCLNALISNLIMRNDPSTLRMVLIDPKMLEMNVYNGIPHLLLPVVTDPREALKAMQWLVAQMEFRYRELSKFSVRNIKQYNDKIAAGEVQDSEGETVTEPMPYFLCIVDELADLMLQLGNDFEGPIARIAQKARAVGIHLILATQRPSVDVLTGVIKANIPCRIAFRVIQRNDSRTILDMNGAEQLLGHGDMLYLQPGRALPVRVHGSFIDVDECEAVAAHWQQYKDHTEEISLNENPAGGGMVTGEDDMFEAAREVVVQHQSGSTSLLQRRLRIGYTRAGRLMDMLEEAGVVGPFTGSKARDVLIKPEELQRMQEGRGLMRKVFCATLGCDKNLVDSEALLGRFAIRGVQPVDDPDAADIWVLNSCGFIDAARSDSETTLRELCEAKEGRTLVVCGCWSQEHSARIRADFPAVDVVAGVGQFDQVVAACLGSAPAPAAAAPAASPFALAGPAVAPDALVVDPMVAPYQGLVDRPLLTPPHVAFVKIGEGCNCACTFCRIPLIRGKQRSRSRAELLAEVRGLVERGVSEIQLVSQNTSDYGRDTGEKLYDLVRDLDGVDGLRTIRLLYLYSGMVSVDDLRRLLDLPAVAPYLDLPIQHASPRILKAMKRPGGEKSSARFFQALRDGRPDLVLRSTALLGFPGEEDEDVAELADFLAEVRFDHLGTHHYSAESGTPSAGLPDRVPAEVILDREALITDLQEDISLARQEERLGQVHEVVIDAVVRPGPDDPHGLAEVLGSLAEGTWRDDRERERFDGVAQSAVSFAVGRSYHFGYDLDGVVVLPLGEAGVGSRLRPGETVRAEFGGVTAYDVWARPVADPGR